MSTVASLLERLTGTASDTGLIGDLVDGDFSTAPAVSFSAPVVIGDPAAGPDNVQQLQIYRDNRVIAADELGMQGPFLMRQSAIARRKEGRRMPFNLAFSAAADRSLPGMRPIMMPEILAPFSPEQLPAAHAGTSPVQLTPNANTVFYTASPAVGWDGY